MLNKSQDLNYLEGLGTKEPIRRKGLGRKTRGELPFYFRQNETALPREGIKYDASKKPIFMEIFQSRANAFMERGIHDQLEQLRSKIKAVFHKDILSLLDEIYPIHTEMVEADLARMNRLFKVLSMILADHGLELETSEIEDANLQNFFISAGLNGTKEYVGVIRFLRKIYTKKIKKKCYNWSSQRYKTTELEKILEIGYNGHWEASEKDLKEIKNELERRNSKVERGYSKNGKAIAFGKNTSDGQKALKSVNLAFNFENVIQDAGKDFELVEKLTGNEEIKKQFAHSKAFKKINDLYESKEKHRGKKLKRMIFEDPEVLKLIFESYKTLGSRLEQTNKIV